MQDEVTGMLEKIKNLEDQLMSSKTELATAKTSNLELSQELKG